MKKLDIVHHKFIMILLILVVFVIGVFFGVRLMGVSGVEGMMVLLFSLTFVNSVILYMLFTQLVHLQNPPRGKRK